MAKKSKDSFSEIIKNASTENQVRKAIEEEKREKRGVLKVVCAKNFDVLEEIKDLNWLRELSIRFLQLKDYSFLSSFNDLRKLTLSGMNISDISFLSDLVPLESLDLSDNDILDIDVLTYQNELKILDLSRNNIVDIESLSHMDSLESLILSQNNIRDITALGSLSNLHTIDLLQNEIISVNGVENLSSLTSINLANNKINDIKPFVNKLKNGLGIGTKEQFYGDSHVVVLKDNPLCYPPIEIVETGKLAVIDWFNAEKKKLNEIKIILVGEPKAGKTSLLRRLKSDEFDINEKQTDGINIEDIKFEETGTFEEQDSLHSITGHFWDFGGQEIMSATHQFFLTKRALYVLVLDARVDLNGPSQIRKWIKQITTTGGNSSIIVIANQIDVNPGFGFQNTYELKKEFPQIKYFIKASCLTGENIEVIKSKLEELILDAELFNTVIDERWIDIKNKLENVTKERHFLNEARFKEICAEYGLNDEMGQKMAILFFHDLGLFLHFDSIDLVDYYVLDPYWITYGVYQILTSIHASKNKGIVSMEDLEFIVNKEEDKQIGYEAYGHRKIHYSANERRFLVDVLNQFKLCFYTSGKSTFIIPDLLDAEEPKTVTNIIRRSKEIVSFVYRYDYLPKSILPRLMVDTHKLQIYKWRTGFVLERQECKALVSVYNESITIIVTGEFKQKREFLSVIRHHIDNINEESNYIGVEHLIPLPNLEGEFVDYNELLEREKDGEKHYTIYKPRRKRFNISNLLEGYDEYPGSSKSLPRLIIEKKELENQVNYTKDSIVEIQEEIKRNKAKLSNFQDDEIYEKLEEENIRLKEDQKRLESKLRESEESEDSLLTRIKEVEKEKQIGREEISKAILELKRPINGNGSSKFQIGSICAYMFLALACFCSIVYLKFALSLEDITNQNQLILVLAQYVFLMSFFGVFLTQANRAYQLYRRLIDKKHRLESLEGALYAKLEISKEINDFAIEIDLIVNEYINKVVFADNKEKVEEVKNDVEVLNALSGIIESLSLLKKKVSGTKK